ncbi:MAG: hypothetical protein H8E37_02405 [Planctomycetes bacterium]|nr:hypothetical protein [Planctomycetota bacterium]
MIDGDTARCLTSRNRQTGFVGTSKAPFYDWEWRKCATIFSRPNLIRLPDGRFIATVALTGEKNTTAVCWFDPKAGTLTKAAELSSTYAATYSGLALDGGHLWVSHYGKKDGKMGIYLSQFKLPEPNRPIR